jgi:predicted dehydrogenase
MANLKIAVIGAGVMGSAHAESLGTGRVQGAELAAVCDIDPAKLIRFPSIPCFVNLRELLDKKVAEAVVIAVPHPAHEETAVAALKAGLHVLCEKPLAPSLLAARRMVAARQTEHQVFAVMLQQRVLPIMHELKLKMQKGELGALQRLNWVVTDWFRTDAYYLDSTWKGTWVGEGGGLVLNQLSHNLDLLQWIFGMPTSVSAICRFGHRHRIETDDEVHAVFELPGGASAVLQASTGEAPGLNRLEVAGELAHVVVQDSTLHITTNNTSTIEFVRSCAQHWARPPHREATVISVEPTLNLHEEMLRNFVMAARGNADLVVTAEEALAQVELSCAILLAGWTGRRICLPLDAEEFERELVERIKNSSLRKVAGGPRNSEVPYYVRSDGVQ